MNESADLLSLWQYACMRYKDASFQCTLLDAQNHHGLSVCAILWVQWLDDAEHVVPASIFDEGLDLCAQIDSHILTLLRNTRSSSLTYLPLDFSFDLIKQPILQSELEIEKALLKKLEQITHTHKITNSSVHPQYTHQYISKQTSKPRAFLKKHLLKEKYLFE